MESKQTFAGRGIENANTVSAYGAASGVSGTHIRWTSPQLLRYGDRYSSVKSRCRGIPGCRQRFMAGLRSQAATKKATGKGGGGRGGRGKKQKRRRYRRRKRTRPSVRMLKRQILRCAGACTMFLFTGAPTRGLSSPSHPVHPPAPARRAVSAANGASSRLLGHYAELLL